MKKLILSSLLSVLFLSTSLAQYRTERTGYEGDYFSLEGALELFKSSNSIRDFERELNTERNWVNNLDLNYDGQIDYIRVEHRQQGNFHAIILQALLDRRDIQDVAVIEIELTGYREAVLQIIGDEDLYGEEVVVEPVAGYSDSRSGYNPDYGDFVNVYYWKPVQYILDRQYRVYASPYHWQYYPTWWSPWRQCSWSVFRPRIVIYHRHYHIAPRIRVIRVHNFYRPYRAYSYTVLQRTNNVRVNHGRPPVQRPAPGIQADRRPDHFPNRDKVADRPEIDARPSAPSQNPPLSRKATGSAAEREITRSRNSQPDQEPRSAATHSGTLRSTDRTDTAPKENPPVSRNRTMPSPEQNTKNSSPQVRQPSRSTPAPSRTIERSTDAGRTPAARPNVTRSAPTQANPPSRNSTPRASTATPSGTRTRSTTIERKPSVGSSRSVPAAKPDANTRTTPKSSGSGGSSRSRKGGG